METPAQMCGGQGSVCLTAWVMQFLVEAREAGFPVDDALVTSLTATLQKSLRSDYGGFIDGESWEDVRARVLRRLTDR